MTDKGALHVITRRNSYALDKMSVNPLWLLYNTQCFFPWYYFKIVSNLGLKPRVSPTFNPSACFLAISHPWSLNPRKIADTVMQVHALQRQRCMSFPGWPVWLWKDTVAQGPLGYEQVAPHAIHSKHTAFPSLPRFWASLKTPCTLDVFEAAMNADAPFSNKSMGLCFRRSIFSYH